MSFSWTRVAAILVKELRDYRRNRFVIGTMAFLPLIFIAAPTIQLLTVPASAASSKLDARIGISLLYLLLIPAIVPSTLSAYSVVGEREQGTLEPILITPIRREEFLVGKALAVAVPTLDDRLRDLRDLPRGRGPARPPGHCLGDLRRLTRPDPAAVHAAARGLVDLGRDRDLRSLDRYPRRPAAQRARQPASARGRRPVAVQSDPASTGLALALAAALLALDALGWRAVAAMFDRERLIAGVRS